MAARKFIPIGLMLVGGAFVLGALFSWFDNLTATEPVGLGKWIFDILEFLVGAGAGIGGWLSLKKIGKSESTTEVVTLGDKSPILTGSNAQQFQVDGGTVFGHVDKVEIHSPEQIAVRALYQLPPAPLDFTGREKLTEQLVADFKGSTGALITATPVQGLVGMGGVGKTALGLVVAHKIASDYPDAQIFLDLKGTTVPLGAMEIMRHVILSFEPGMDLRALDEASMASAYRSLLHGKRALLFFDNARSADQIASLRPPESCAMLVTSRWGFAMPGLGARRLDVMQPEDAAHFILKLCPRIGERAAQLANACVYLPLALRIAGSFLHVNPAWTVERYLEKLNDNKQRLPTLKESREEAGLSAEPDLLATFELSYNQLTEEDRRRWRALGVFPTSFDAAAVQAVWEVDEKVTTKLLGLLCRYSLLEFDETSSRYGLHDLLGEYALAKMKEGEETNAKILHALHYSEVLGDINQMYLQGGKSISVCLRLYDAEWLNIEAGQRISSLYMEENREAAKACNWYAWQGSINSLRMKAKDRILWIQSGILASRILGNKEAESAHLGNLGNSYAELGDARKAIEFHGQRLTIARETGDRHGEGNALGSLGIAYYRLGDVNKAIELHEQRLTIARETGNRRGQGNALMNLGNAYAALGDARKALEYHEQTLVISREIGDRLQEEGALVSLGIAYYRLGEPRKSIELYERSLAIAREIGNRRGEANALGNMGLAYADLGEPRKAIEFYERQLVITREFGNRGGEANALGNMGLAYADLGDVNKACEFYEKDLVIRREIGDRRGEAHSSWNLGLTHEKQGELEKAIQLMQVCVEYEREIGHPDAEKHAAGVEEIRKKL